GRDGEPAECDLLFNYADTRTQEFFIDGNNPGPDVIRDLYMALHKLCGPENNEVTLPIREMTDMLNLKNSMQVGSALSHLVRSGYLERFDVQGERARGTRLRDPAIGPGDLELDLAALAEKDRRDRSKLEAMIKFCYDREICRQAWILDYFGESEAQPCGSCDVCGEEMFDANTREPTDEEFVIVQKALSGVARTCG